MTKPTVSLASSSRFKDAIFYLVMSGLSSSFVLLIVLMLVADIVFVSWADFQAIYFSREIRFSFFMTLVTCTLAAIWSLIVATPLAYLLSRFRFPGRNIIDAIVEIPIVLPPLVLGLSLLILFHADFKIDSWLRSQFNFSISFHNSLWPALLQYER
jgi:molybdate transport system permease protein